MLVGDNSILQLVLVLCVLLLADMGSQVMGSDGDDTEMSPLGSRMDQLQALFQLQTRVLKQLQRTLQEQNIKLSHQETMILNLRKTLKQLQSYGNSADPENQPTKDSPMLLEPKDSDIAAEHGWFTSAVKPNVPHHVTSRSDDAGPLEVVVNQLSQQLIGVKADLAALKAQTNVDITALQNTDKQQLSQLSSEIHALKIVNVNQDQNIQLSRSSTFTRWGSSHCGNASQLVYSGVLASSPPTYSGGATNFLCMTMNPVISNRSRAGTVHVLEGVEYKTFDSNDNKDPVCSVCRSSFSSTIMIPGTNVCTKGWHHEYSGFLMAGQHNAVSGSEFICVDEALESRPGTNAAGIGKDLYFAASTCGTLPCDPYVEAKLVTCVVCSQ